jgi:hypothetical protein
MKQLERVKLREPSGKARSGASKNQFNSKGSVEEDNEFGTSAGIRGMSRWKRGTGPPVSISKPEIRARSASK